MGENDVTVVENEGTAAQAADTGSKKKGLQLKKAPQYPDKIYVNMLKGQVRKISKTAILVILLIVVAAGAFVKFMVLDQLAALRAAQKNYERVEAELTAIQTENADYDEVSQKYAQVTEWYLTDEEKAIINKVDVLDMLEADVMPFVDVKNIKVSGNTVTVTTDVTDMQVVSRILYNLQTDDRNLSATVTTTAAAKSAVSGEMVTASIIIQYTGETEDTEKEETKNSSVKTDGETSGDKQDSTVTTDKTESGTSVQGGE